MKQQMAFVGIGIEAGQIHEGLSLSSRFARKRLKSCVDFTDFGDIAENTKRVPLTTSQDIQKLDLRVYEKAAETVMRALRSHTFTLNWGGDHSIALSTLSAFLSLYPEGQIVWVDAHADLNKPDTSPTGNFHGMPLSFLMGLNSCSLPALFKTNLKPSQLIYVGLRSLDPYEQETIQKLGITYFDMKFIRQYGMRKVLEAIQSQVGSKPTHVSFDIDSLDPVVAPSTGVPETQGLNLDEAKILSSFLAHKTHCKSLDIVEVNPFIGTLNEVEQTYQAAFIFLNNFILNKRGKNVGKFQSNQRKSSTQEKRDFSISI